MRFKKTEICQTCAKIKNVCQTCVLDLEYGLPVQVRDSVLQVESSVPRSDVNREFFIQTAEGKLGETDTLVNYGKAASIAKESLRKLARTEPYYKRNRAHICSFYVKGECKRGDECPYRHELPVDNELSHQNIKDRYYGQNDPVANKILGGANKPISKPADPSVMSLFLTGVETGITQEDLRSLLSQYGEVKSVILIGKSKTAFINFATRSGAEEAVDKTRGSLVINGHNIRVQWGKSRPGTAATAQQQQQQQSEAGPGADGFIDPDSLPAIPAPPGAVAASSSRGVVYASMDQNLLGTSAKTFRADD